MFKRYFKRVLSIVLIAALLIQILPATAKGAEISTTATEELSIVTQTGLSDMYEYQVYDAGRAGTVKVNTYTGKLYVKRTDMTLSGERMPMEITFYYDGINGTYIYFQNSGNVTEDGEAIWTEIVNYGIGEIGAELYIPANVATTAYHQMYLTHMDEKYSFDSYGRLTKISNEYDEIITIEYPQTGETRIITETTRQIYRFDGCGRVTRCELQNISGDAGSYTTVYGYTNTYDFYTNEEGKEVNGLVDVEYFNADGVIEEEKEAETIEDIEITDDTQDSEENQYTTNYDSYGNVIKEIHTEGNLQQTTQYTYDSNGNYLLYVTDEDGYTESYLYDELSDDIIGIMDKNGNTTQFAYNGLRELSLASMKVSGLTKAKLNQLTVQFIEGPDEIRVSYEYEAGRLTSIYYGDCIYEFAYDKWGNLLTVTLDDRLLVTYDYGTKAYKGLIQSASYGSNSVYYAYDHMERVSAIGYAQNSPRYQYTYTSDGDISTIYDNTQGLVTKYTENGYQIYKGTTTSMTELLMAHGHEQCRSDSI